MSYMNPCTEFRIAIYSQFHLSPQYADRCSHYFIRHWQLSYFLSRTNYGTILEYADTTYNIVLQDQLEGLLLTEQIKLSFRKPANPNLPAYVLVKKV